jgi:serine/threonine protein kinase
VAGTLTDHLVNAREGAELRPGEVVDRYRIVSLLGAGAMGHVYRAHDPDLQRDVALKILRRQEAGLEKRLFREAQALARLDHPHLVTVHDVGACGGVVFVALELVEGVPLSLWMREPGRTLRERIDALLAAGRGLAAAHAAGVVHRDVKPDNVMVEPDGNVEIVDFGLARGIGERDDAREPDASDAFALDLTVTGAILGTPAYMAPEQHAGDPADARSDQFSFAVTCWEAIHGVRPFAGRRHAEIAAAVLAGELREPTARVPARLNAALRRALACEPEQRFPDLRALLAAIEDAMQPRWKRWLGVS